jgi:hypothetical protein
VAPYHHSFIITVTPGPSGQPTATYTANADGTYQLDLPPGQYRIAAQGQLVADAQPVTVNAGQYAQYNIGFDSGIR